MEPVPLVRVRKRITGQAKRAEAARKRMREALLRAATRVFANRGYRAASISDIIAAAGVARGTFYLYFRGKQDALFAVIDDLREQQKVFIASHAEQAPNVTAADLHVQMRQGFLAWLRFYDERRDALKILVRESNLIDSKLERKRAEVRGAIIDNVSKRIRRLQNTGIYQRKLAPEIVGHFFIGIVDEISLAYLQDDSKPDLDLLAEQCATFALDGMLRR
jgi:AcrR family transcriptional regulator